MTKGDSSEAELQLTQAAPAETAAAPAMQTPAMQTPATPPERLYPERALIEAIRLTFEQHPVFGYYPPETRAAQERALLENIKLLSPEVVDRQEFLRGLVGEARRIVAQDRSGMIVGVAKELGKRGVSRLIGDLGKRK
jgi:hypothetical protein